MSLVIRCLECEAPLPNQYSGLPCCGGYECVRIDAGKVPIIAKWPKEWGTNPLSLVEPVHGDPFLNRRVA